MYQIVSQIQKVRIKPIRELFRSAFLTCALLWLGAIHLPAQVGQGGWQWIDQNDFVMAKKAFEARLADVPDDEDALVGMIFISETVQDYDSYKKYIGKLIEKSYDENYLSLFGHMFDCEPDHMLQKDLNETLKTVYREAFSDSLFHQRKFTESRQMLGKAFGDYNWSVIGPFSNNSGSGFTKPFPVEHSAYDPEARFENEEGLELIWHNKLLRSQDGKVSFFDVLQQSSNAVYYANTFLSIPADRLLQLRIGRSKPLKIWLDDDLVFANHDNIHQLADAELIELEIGRGTHRLLVKYADYPDQIYSKSIDLGYYDQYDYGDGYGAGYNAQWRNQDYGYYPGQDKKNDFRIRLTDHKGRLYEDIGTSFSGEYTPRNHEPKLISFPLIRFFEAALEESPKDVKLYYLLCKAYMLYDMRAQGEAVFFRYFEQNEAKSYFRFLLARFYAANGKSQKAEELITGQDEHQVPILALMKNEHDKIDLEKDESQYLASLDKMLRVSPTNWRLISYFLDFYQKKGKAEEKRHFIKRFLEKHPEKKFQKRFEPYLKDDSYKPSSYKPTTDKEREKKAKEALKNMKKAFRLNDYYTVISHYKRTDKEGEVLKLYDELIELFPYKISWYKEKAKFLFEKDRLEDALSTLEMALHVNKYDKAVYETMGDIYFEQDEKEKALKNYNKTRELNLLDPYNYGNDELDKKIEKIKDKASLKEYFKSISFKEILRDEGWKGAYKDDESVVLLYTVESALDNENTIDYTQKMLIYIQNDAGAKYWTEANFAFLGNINFVKVLKKDGRETSPDRSYGYVVFKNLEAGDIIQIEGHSKANMNNELPGQMFHIAAISHDFPVYKAQMEFIHPKDIDLDYSCYRIGCNAKISPVGEEYRKLTWEFENIPKMEREEAILDDLDSYAWIMFSTMNDWSKVVDWYLAKTYRRLEMNYEIEAEMLKLLSSGMSEEEIVERIYNYITSEITYSHVGFLNSNYVPKKPSITISDQIGDCKDVASLMIAMLRSVGIEAYYVLVRSSNYTSQRPLPAIAAFNHVIVGYVLSDGQMRYVDLTTDYYPHYVIPEFDNHSWALLIKEGETDVFQLPNDMLDQTKSRLEIDIEAKIKSDRSLQIGAQARATGVLSGKFRETLNQVTTRDERIKYLSEYFGEGSFDHLTIFDFKFQDLGELTLPLRAELQLKAYNHIEKVSNFYIIQIPLLKSITTKPALFTSKRYNNLDLHALFETAPTFQKIDLEIPPEYQLMEVPEDIRFDNAFGSYALRFEKTEKGVRITRSLVMKTRLVDYNNYDQFKKFYFDLLDADRTKLALSREE